MKFRPALLSIYPLSCVVPVGVVLVSSAAVCVILTVLSSASALAQTDWDTIYSYRNEAGRKVYVNGMQRIPGAMRKRAQMVDLSHISLNHQLAADLEQAVDTQLEQMLDSKYCTTARAAANTPWWSTVWRDNGHLVIIAAILLLFLLASPYLIRTLGPPQWGRILLFLVPVLAVVGILATAAVKTSSSMHLAQTAADLCQSDLYNSIAKTPSAQAQRIHLIDRLQKQIVNTHQLQQERIGR